MLVERGPAPEVLCRDVNPYVLQLGFRDDRLRQGIAELQVLQTDISDILQVAGLRRRLQRSIIASIAYGRLYCPQKIHSELGYQSCFPTPWKKAERKKLFQSPDRLMLYA